MISELTLNAIIVDILAATLRNLFDLHVFFFLAQSASGVNFLHMVFTRTTEPISSKHDNKYLYLEVRIETIRGPIFNLAQKIWKKLKDI